MKQAKKIRVALVEELTYAVDEAVSNIQCDANLTKVFDLCEKIKHKAFAGMIKEIRKAANDIENAVVMLEGAKDDIECWLSDNIDITRK